MMHFTLSRRLFAEFVGTAFLVCTVVGSGIMADKLTGDVALALLGNTLPTGCILVVLIAILAPVSGAHFNPAVSLAFAMRRELPLSDCAFYSITQIAGGLVGCVCAHVMFDLQLLQISHNARSGTGQWVGEIIATFGLVFIILVGVRLQKHAIPWLVGLYITAAYWFTSSTSFANPAVAIARGFSDSFAGIRPQDIPAFIAAEIIGAVLAVMIVCWLLKEHQEK